MQRIGIIIGRMNPPHIGHISLIKKSLSENKKTLLYIGESIIQDERNLFSFKEIYNFLYLIFEKEILKNDLDIHVIQDVPTDKKWTENLFQKIIPYTSKINNLIFYGGDLKNDYAIMCIKKYIPFFKEYKVYFQELNRYEKYLVINGKKIEISGTSVRQAIKEGNDEIIQKMLDEKIYKILTKI